MLLRLKSLWIFQACIGLVISNEEFFDCPHWPNVMILGAQKAATTTLYRTLIEHPDVCQATKDADEPEWHKKEIHYFDNDEIYVNGPEWYCSKFSQCIGKKVTIESTPNYLNFDVAKRMKETLPPSTRKNLKMIAILRQPVDRILSWYNHVRGIAGIRGDEDCHQTPWCEQFLRKSFEGVTPTNSGVRPNTNITIAQGDHLDKFISFEEFYLTETYAVDLGRYSDILEEFFEVFDEKNILILNFDSLMNNPKKYLNIISGFLDIDGKVWPSDFSFLHKNAKIFDGKAKKGEIDCKFIEEIDDFYQPHNRKLHYMLFKNRAKFWHDQPYFKHFEKLPRCSDSQVFSF